MVRQHGRLRRGAQQPARVKRIGLMGNLQLRPIESFRNRLRELGYIEGQNLIVEYRFAEGREATPALPQNWLRCPWT